MVNPMQEESIDSLILEWIATFFVASTLSGNYKAMPDKHVTRQYWQVAVEELVYCLRKELGQPAFGLTETEITIHFHLPLHEFINLVRKKLRFSN